MKALHVIALTANPVIPRMTILTSPQTHFIIPKRTLPSSPRKRGSRGCQNNKNLPKGLFYLGLSKLVFSKFPDKYPKDQKETG
jgi:hypothetical protein